MADLSSFKNPWFAIFALFFGLHFLGLVIDQNWLLWLSKPFPVLALMAWVWSTAGKQNPYAKWLCVGFVFSVMGDVFLMLHYKPMKDLLFIFGLVSFLTAHLCYIRAFLLGKPPLRLERLLPPLIAVSIMGVIIVPGLGKFTVPVIVYMAVITTMVWRAAARIGHSDGVQKAQVIGLIGAVIFMLSDSLIAWNKFYAPIPNERFFIMATYWLGQLGIAFSSIEAETKDAQEK